MQGLPLNVQGWVKIYNADTQEVLVNKKNSIHFENFSEALALSICAGPLNASNSITAGGFINAMSFGNGGTNVSEAGIITYKSPNFVGSSANLYSPTHYKIVNQNFGTNQDPTNNYITVNHTVGKAYTDILTYCQLEYTETPTLLPTAFDLIDNTTNLEDSYVFDELGLVSIAGKLLTHVIFHPIQKSQNRLLKIEYTIRVQTLTNLSGLA